MSPRRLSIIRNFCGPESMRGRIAVRSVGFDADTGELDVEDLKGKVTKDTAAVYLEIPSYLGTMEPNAGSVSEIAHDNGAQVIVGVDPISLGVLAPPSDYGADLVCGDIQTLGLHMHCGGGMGGFIASRDEEKYVAEYPLHLISIASTAKEGERGFGFCRFDRTSYVLRDKAKDWVGTSSGLWSIVSAVYMSLMGPKGMKEVGEAIIQKSHYAASRISEIQGLRIRFPRFFKEFVVDFGGVERPVAQVSSGLLEHGIFGGHDLGQEFPQLVKCALYCVTESHSKEDIDRLVRALEEVVG